MFGNRRRKINADQAPRDQFGRKTFHGAFKGGFSSGNQNTVADEHGFVSQPFFSSKDRKAPKIPQQKLEDFMDDEDFDDFGRSQITIAQPKNYSTPSGSFSAFTEDEVNILYAFGYDSSDLNGSFPAPEFSHESEPSGNVPGGDDWITIKPPEFDHYSMPELPENYKFEIVKLPILEGRSNTGSEVPQLEEFNLATMFHLEGERELARETFGAPEKRVTVRWEPHKLLKKRFVMDVSGKAATDQNFRRRRDD
ncbi:hypothetical protein TRFO_20443 [Tritrichomonas foetus]|uniref:G patch domain-containing protein n=1 Tax=Tritrichomonas foetus TaxID=1144522 RepID=A0A1J4KKF6_9EUKA|nr:hypothetical protein TRFO_20443 [Tritrichomonas foetus]|eukprot:OHT10316.1 hypothetical protein TRFO_20443 [Tritrichomonas foetus]